jgi:LacI family transcriptional regulator
MITIRAIATAANVSRGTVDKVLNNRPGVSQEVRDKVRQIADELGYKPNLAGKALAFQKKDTKIGIILTTTRDKLFADVLIGVEQAVVEFRGFGIDFDIMEMQTTEISEQVEAIYALAERGISGLAIVPYDHDDIRTALLRLSQMSIPVVTYNTDISGVNRLCYVGQNSRKSGRVAGDLMHKLLPKGGKIVCVNGPDQFKSLHDRLAGFKSVLRSEWPELEIVEIIQNLNDNILSYEMMSAYLKSGKPVDGVFVIGSGVSGVGDAIRESKRKDIRFISYDKLPETQKQIKEGLIDFTITQEPRMQGYLPVKILFEYNFYGYSPASKNMYTKIEIRTKENID